MKRKDIIRKLIDYLRGIDITTFALSSNKGVKTKFYDIRTLHKQLDCFRSGSSPWEVSIINKSTLSIIIPEMDMDNLNRDVDYKICLLKSAFG